jgi:hypothetical protein
MWSGQISNRVPFCLGRAPRRLPTGPRSPLPMETILALVPHFDIYTTLVVALNQSFARSFDVV